jgi:pimeloyl-ACP methyl ester carboxylesterase
MKREHIIVAIHGILTGETSRAWQKRFEAHIWRRHPDSNIEVIGREYFAGVVPAWNVFVRNPRFADALVDLLKPYAKAGAMISFVSHSNGADIAVRAIRKLAAQTGARTNALVCIGAAIQSDVGKNGILELLTTNDLGRAVAYCSESDRTLATKVKWPYGDLGRTGFLPHVIGLPLRYEGDVRLMTRWFPGYSHTGYFASLNEDKTYDMILRDVAEFEFSDARRATVSRGEAHEPSNEGA